MTQVTFLQAPSFSAQERTLLHTACAWLRAVSGWDLTVEITAPDSDDVAPGEQLGQYAAIVRDAYADEGGPVFTVQLTREPGRRFVLLRADGHPRDAGGNLAALLHGVMGPGAG